MVFNYDRSCHWLVTLGPWNQPMTEKQNSWLNFPQWLMMFMVIYKTKNHGMKAGALLWKPPSRLNEWFKVQTHCSWMGFHERGSLYWKLAPSNVNHSSNKQLVCLVSNDLGTTITTNQQVDTIALDNDQ